MAIKSKSVNFNVVCLLIIISAGLVYSVLWENAPFVATDTSGYVEVATDLKDGQLDQLHNRTPGYPVLLLMTNSLAPSKTLFLTQLSLYLFSVLLLVVYLNEIKITKPFVLVFLLLSFIPPSVVHTVYMLTETLTTFLLVTGTISLLWWLRKGNILAIILSGIMFAFSAIVRPTYQLLFMMMAGVFVISSVIIRNERRRVIIAIGSISLASCLIIGGLSIYNLQHFHYFGLTPMLGVNLSTRTVRVVERLPDEYKDVREFLIKARDGDLVERNGSHTGVMYIWGAIPDLQRMTGLNKVELSQYMLRLNLQLIRDAPLEYAVEVVKSLATYWLPSSTDISNFHSRPIQLLWALIHLAVIVSFFAMFLFMLCLVILIWLFPAEIKKPIMNVIRPFEHLAAPILVSVSIIIYTMLISTMLEVGNPRYRTPTDPLALFALTVGAYVFTQISSQSKSGCEHSVHWTAD